MSLIPLPEDINQPKDAVAAYKKIVATEGNVAADRMDVTYLLHVEEMKGGKQGWLERLMEKLGLEGDRRSKVVISDDISIFRTFRLPAPHGLGLPRTDISGYGRGRLRALAQNRAWTLQNPDRALAMLQDKAGSEDAIREEIKREKPQTLKTDAESFETVSFRLTSQDAAWVRSVLAAAMAQRAYLEQAPHEGSEGAVAAKTLKDVLQDWVDAEYEAFNNVDFMPGGRLAPEESHAEIQEDAGAAA